jgi:hypothetical protein
MSVGLWPFGQKQFVQLTFVLHKDYKIEDFLKYQLLNNWQILEVAHFILSKDNWPNDILSGHSVIRYLSTYQQLTNKKIMDEAKWLYVI